MHRDSDQAEMETYFFSAQPYPCLFIGSETLLFKAKALDLVEVDRRLVWGHVVDRIPGNGIVSAGDTTSPMLLLDIGTTSRDTSRAVGCVCTCGFMMHGVYLGVTKSLTIYSWQ